MSAERLCQGYTGLAESPLGVDAALPRGDGDSAGAPAPAESTEPRGKAVFVSPAPCGGDAGRAASSILLGGRLSVLESPGAREGAGGAGDVWGDSAAAWDGEDPHGGVPGGEAEDSGEAVRSSAVPGRILEGAGVTAAMPGGFGFFRTSPRAPAMPRDETAPEPVAGVRRRGERPFRRNLSVDEAIGVLAQPPAGQSEAERAAAVLRARRPAKAGSALHLAAEGGHAITPQQRLLLLDTWTRSGLPAGDFAALVGVSKHTLYSWKKRFDEHGPAGLEDAPRGGPKGSKTSEVTKRAILMIKQAHPDYGCERISDLLARGPALPASAGAVARVLKEAGYEAVERPAERHPPPVRRFERGRPNALWQTDLFTFVLKRQNRRLYLVVFLDDHSRFVTGWGCFASPSTEMVIDALKAAVAFNQAPEELLTDNGPQYVTWRGSGKFSEACRSLGIKQIVARPRHPQTLGKVERFWGTLWREFLAQAIFGDSQDARRRIGLFIEAYNHDRPHQGMDGATPAERYFGNAAEAKAARERRLADNRLRLAAGLDPVTGDGSPPMDERLDHVPAPGEDPLTAGLAAAAGMAGPAPAAPVPAAVAAPGVEG